MLIGLVIAWTCVGVFVATAIITILALVKVIEFADRKYLDRLFAVLVVEVVLVGVGFFTGYLQNPAVLEEEIKLEGKRELATKIEKEIETIVSHANRSPEFEASREAALRAKQRLDSVLSGR